MSYGFLLILYLAMVFLPVILIFLLLFKKGRFVKNTFVFAAVQLCTLLYSILTLTSVGKDSFIGILLSCLCILGCIASVILKKFNYLYARLLSIILIIVSFAVFFYI
ncbi:MAG: hypothetical protein GX275_06410 [Clostridiales bacterium]|nr:hypothetical protein [Clostridiales bacterium]